MGLRQLSHWDFRPSAWLVCLDLQPEAQDAVPPELDRRLALCRQVILHARAAGWPVVHVLHGLPDPQDRDGLGRSAPFPGLEPAPFEPVLFRRGISAFSNSRFAELAQAARDDEAIAVALSFWPVSLFTAIDAHERGVRMTFLDDTMSAPAQADFDAETVRGVLLGMAAPFVQRTSFAELIRRPAGLSTLHAANQH